MNLRGWRTRRQEQLQGRYREKIGQMQGDLQQAVLRFKQEEPATDQHHSRLGELIGTADALIAFHERTPAIMTQLRVTTRSVVLVGSVVVIGMLAVVGATVEGGVRWVWMLLAVPTLLIAVIATALGTRAQLVEPASELQADCRVAIGALAAAALCVALLSLGVLPAWWLIWVLPFLAWSAMRLFDGALT